MTTTGARLPPHIARILVDPAAYADARIHETYRWLREHQPLGLAEPAGYDPFWVVTRYADLLHVSRNNDLFHNGDRAPVIVDKASDDLIRAMTGGSPHLIRTLIHLDAADHSKARTLAQMWFMPANLKKMEDRIRELARATVDRMLSRDGRCDFVNDVALHYPLRVVMKTLGMPEADELLMLKLTQEIFSPLDPDLAPKLGNDGAVAVLAQAFQSTVQVFGEYFGKLSAERRANPRDDIISLIANARIDGKPLPPEVEMGYYIVIAAAGHDTTSSSTAGAVWALCERPDQFAKLKQSPALISSMVDEAIRWTTPVKTFMRTATADTEVGGQHIAKGDWLMLCYASANRDESVFKRPYEFRVDRSGPTRHIAFGFGAHVCLGQHLARLEMRLLFEELLTRIKSISLDGTPTMTQAMFVNGPKTLPVRFELG
ncbi:MAG: cytochrome [Hydrocarboniphaga sp.]|uniref:cytochrome P450 n=1 Tax=Hydrocarboniphaga sp. TaxID=2033016 RepID=UPI0026396807|nr:cytochrome P450 [Hydrocarboniphaga sp.]MDB5969683.1 cytochrome [Hydrocarboniphaga sp.]